ncbi:MAG: hypothetical protein ACPIOQ_08340, partial [Promethearchaeia archaeon]
RSLGGPKQRDGWRGEGRGGRSDGGTAAKAYHRGAAQAQGRRYLLTEVLCGPVRFSVCRVLNHQCLADDDTVVLNHQCLADDDTSTSEIPRSIPGVANWRDLMGQTRTVARDMARQGLLW